MVHADRNGRQLDGAADLDQVRRRRYAVGQDDRAEILVGIVPVNLLDQTEIVSLRLKFRCPGSPSAEATAQAPVRQRPPGPVWGPPGLKPHRNRRKGSVSDGSGARPPGRMDPQPAPSQLRFRLSAAGGGGVSATGGAGGSALRFPERVLPCAARANLAARTAMSAGLKNPAHSSTAASAPTVAIAADTRLRPGRPG